MCQKLKQYVLTNIHVFSHYFDHEVHKSLIHFFFLLMGIEPSASSMQGKFSTTELHPSAQSIHSQVTKSTSKFA
jgi:hypothetical protein